ncbi:MAG TPA: hypothetical protein VJA87_03275, partial [Candidatus Paceibacterota bacterium]
MKKLLLILIALAALSGALFAVWYLKQDKQEPAVTPPIEFPIANPRTNEPTTRSAIMLAAQDGQIEVNDFLKNSDVHEDVINLGYYDLGYKPPEAIEEDDSPFHIVYIAETSYFNVVINKEPIGENRRVAENYLISTLGINQSDMCRLVYTVSVPNHVNSSYSGTSLGFSFCP